MHIPYFPDKNPDKFSPLALAYIGDAVYEVYIRSYVLSGGNCPVNKLHKTSTRYVSARGQSLVAHALEPMLTPEEAAVYKRGRNAHSNTSAKNADIVDYRHATGFEALIGYLYISGSAPRLEEIIAFAIKTINDAQQ